MSRGFWVLIALAVLGAACSSSITREEAVQDFVDEGFEQATAVCILDDIEAAGFTLDDLVGDELSTGLEAAISGAVNGCLTGADAESLLDTVNLDEVRQQFIDQFVASGSVDEQQAECIMNEVEGGGVSIAEMARLAIDDTAQLEAMFAAATVTCLGG